MDRADRNSHDFCRTLARREAKNFYYSFLVLPPDRRRAMCALYAFMRRTDDLADDAGTIDEKRRRLDAWRSDLESALDGRVATWPGLSALAETVHYYAIPPRHLHEVIDGVAMDLEPRPFETFDDLYAYCYRVASAVGLCCIRIWGFQSRDGLAESLAESCGIALQLTNILRDVREDLGLGRIYLPHEDLERFKVRPDDLRLDAPRPAVRDLFEFEARRAYDYYAKARPLGALVAPVGRPVLGAIVGIYRALLDEIARRNYNVLAGRISLPAWKKTVITLGSLGSALPGWSRY
jgi:phytoene synthase